MPEDGTKSAPQDLHQWFYADLLSNPYGKKNPHYAQYILPVCHPVLKGGINPSICCPRRGDDQLWTDIKWLSNGMVSPLPTNLSWGGKTLLQNLLDHIWKANWAPCTFGCAVNSLKCDRDEEFWCCEGIINRRFSSEGGSDVLYLI